MKFHQSMQKVLKSQIYLISGFPLLGPNLFTCY